MEEAKKVRLVRCPKCENLLPELPDFSIYQCGGCGAVLKAKKKGILDDGLSETSDDATGARISQSPTVVNVSDLNIEGADETERGRTMERSHNEREVSSSSSISRTENREALIDPHIDSRAGERVRRMERFDDEYRSPSVGNGYSSKENRPGYVNSYSDNELQESRVPRGSMRPGTVMNQWHAEGNGSMLSHKNAMGVASNRRFGSSMYPDEGPSSHDMDSFYGYGEKMRYQSHDLNGLHGAKNLENDRAELLRKLDELKDRLTRPSDVANEPAGRIGSIPGSGPPPPDPYGRNHTPYLQEGLSASHGERKPPLATSDDWEPRYLRHSYGHVPYRGSFGSAMHDSYPRYNFPHKSFGYGSSYQPETLQRGPPKYLHQHHQGHIPGHLMDINHELFTSHPHETFFHQPACSCMHCVNKNSHLPSNIYPPDLGRRRSPNDPYNPNFHHQGLQGYNYEGLNSRYWHSRHPQTIRSMSTDSEPSSFPHHRPRKLVIAHGSGQSCRPVAGGAPFVTCCNCFELLKLPRRHISMAKKQQKMKCGACSSIIMLELKDEGIIVSVPEHGHPVTSDFGNGSSGTLDEKFKYSPGGSNTNKHDDCESSFPPTGKKSNSGESEKLEDPLSSCSSFSEDEQSPENVVFNKDIPHSVESPIEELNPFTLSDLPVQESPDQYSSHNMVNRNDKGNISQRPEQERIGLDRTSSRQHFTKDASVATEMDASLDEFSGNSCVSQDSVDTSNDDNKPRIQKGRESFLVGLIKKSFKDFSKSNQNVEDGEQLHVFINGHFIPDRAVKKAEKLAGPIQPGDYWYDVRAGFWGVMGHPCLGIVMPNIEEFNYPMPKNCAAGNTGVFVNGRELHQKDLDLLASRGLPITRHRSYSIEISGKVVDEQTGEELDGLGKLAPTVEKAKHGFGMKVPRILAQMQ